MKITGCFLVILVLVLNGIPCCADNCKEESSSGQHTESSASGELCSPFFTCGSCTGFLYGEKLLAPLPLNPDFKENIRLISENTYSEYISYIWQPPRINRHMDFQFLIHIINS